MMKVLFNMRSLVLKMNIDQNAHEVLKRFMDPPSDTAIMSALDSLKDVKALV